MLFHNLVNSNELIPIFLGPLKLKRFGGLLHLALKLQLHSILSAVQKPGNFMYHSIVFRLLYIIFAWCHTLSHMIIETYLIGERLTLAKRVKTVEQLLRLLRCVRIRIRAEILPLILHDTPCNLQLRMLFIRYFNIRKGLIVLKQYIITRLMLLNQIAFQYKCFHIASRYNEFKITNFRYEPLCLPIMTTDKIRADPVFEHLRLAYINNDTLIVFH
ncbi:hypothetical protein D3C81_1524710 [compost metagenome]